MDQYQRQLTIEMSPMEGQAFLACVERLIERLPHDGRRCEWLEEIVERVGCANAVALWLRERARLELGYEEADELLTLLAPIVDDDNHGLSACSVPLTGLCTQLRRALRLEPEEVVHV